MSFALTDIDEIAQVFGNTYSDEVGNWIPSYTVSIELSGVSG